MPLLDQRPIVPVSPLLSVVIPAKNAADSIGGTLGSLAVDRDIIHEILVVDDASGDHTAARARAFAKDLHLPVKVIPASFSNPGAARNLGMRAATGDLLFFIDADDEVLPDGLRFLTNCLLANSDADLVIGAYVRRVAGTAEKLKVPLPYDTDSMRNACDYLANRHRSIAIGSALVRRNAVGDATFPENIDFDEDTFFWAGVLTRANVVTAPCPVSVYNADGSRMERRLVAASYRDFDIVCGELDKLRDFGIARDILDWRKGWLARRLARALIRQKHYDRAAELLRIASAQHRRIRFSTKTLSYWMKIHFGSILEPRR